jgi:cation diffusion facilitator family transporter
MISKSLLNSIFIHTEYQIDNGGFMIVLLIKKFIPNYQHTENRAVRESYSILGAVLGILCNLSLFAIKLTIGLLANSLAVISDAFNNLSDLGFSVIAIVGIKLSNKPADEEHPYGHGRYEYIASLILSFFIIYVGFALLKSAIDKIIDPQPIAMNTLSIVILILSISVKVWMFSYNRYIAKTINSTVNEAIAKDSLSDVIATSAIIFSVIIMQVAHLNIDGYIAVLASLLIVKAGFDIAKQTVDLLLGSEPDPEIVEEINRIVLSGEGIIGSHDLIIHDYGPNRVIGSIHAEVPDTASLKDVHTVIDELEEKLEKETGVHMVIHIDPVETDRAAIQQVKKKCMHSIKSVTQGVYLKTLRMNEEKNRYMINMELVVANHITIEEIEPLTDKIYEHIQENNPCYSPKISHIYYEDDMDMPIEFSRTLEYKL